MFLCYIDESGVPNIPGNTTHYILSGISIPVWHWHKCDKEIRIIKEKYNIAEHEIHVAWMLREYREQYRIPDFASKTFAQRRYEVARLRTKNLITLSQSGPSQKQNYKQTKKNYKKTEAYIHLTFDERKEAINDIASKLSEWGFARLFAECVDKIHFDQNRTSLTVDEQAFEQIVSRFEQYLVSMNKQSKNTLFGLLIHDHNQTVSKRHTEMMKLFHHKGTFFTSIKHIIETPLFVDSELTSMVQMADLCSYALRRYLEKGEEELFDLIFSRAERRDGIVVSVRHFSDLSCNCKICVAHKNNV